MKTRFLKFLNYILLIALLGACGTRTTSTPNANPATATTAPTEVPLPSLSITLGKTNDSQGIRLDQGGDVDTQTESKGNPPLETRGSGNNKALASSDGNKVPDSYLQFNVDDRQLSNGKPTSHVRVEVDYFDIGKDSFSLQYDALSGQFAGGGSVVKIRIGDFVAI